MKAYRLKIYFSFLTFFLLLGSSYAQNRVIPAEHKVVSPTAKAGNLIDVNVAPYPESNFTPTQLVQEVLFETAFSCSPPNITNVVISPNQAITEGDRFWGYFNKGTSAFPFEDGIVLTTGHATLSGNTPYGLMGDPTGTNSDADLVAAVGATQTLHDAVFLEFDFVPTGNKMSFNYIFASEEYTGGFPCSGYEDAFALLLKPNLPGGGGVYTNLAILPAGAGPVTATNIVPDDPQFTCGPINGQYYEASSPNNQTNIYGRTVPLVAQADVTPGQSYHIKMVLADARDNSYDSAVFLEAGSFDIGLQLLDPGGNPLPSEVIICDNAPLTISSCLTTTGAEFQWFFNGDPIPGATSVSYTATQTGLYTLEVTVPGILQTAIASITVKIGEPPVVNDVTFTQCYGPGNVSFNLTQTEVAVSTTPGVTYTYYENLADAQDGNANFIADPANYMSAGGETIYVRVIDEICPSIAEIDLVKAPEMIAEVILPNTITCAEPEITIDASSSTYPAGSTFHWLASNGGYIVSGVNTLNPVVNAQGTYTLTIVKTYQPGDITCTATVTVDVFEDKNLPTVALDADRTVICYGESVILTADGGDTYYWPAFSTTGNVVTVSPTTTTTYEVYSIGTNGCQSPDPAIITIEVVPAISSTLPAISGQICTGDSITLDAGTGPNYTYLWSNGETTQTITVSTPGTYTVIIDNGVCEKEFTTEVIQALVPQIIDINFENNVLTLTASNPSNGTLEYSIDGGFTWQDSNVFNGVQNNIDLNIQVRVKRTSCTGVLEYNTFVIQNVITPNGDGINDKIDFSAIRNLNNFGGKIFDRYGRELFHINKDQYIWDGRFQSRTLPTSTYWYQYNFEHPASKQPIIKTGWILLKNRE